MAIPLAPPLCSKYRYQISIATTSLSFNRFQNWKWNRWNHWYKQLGWTFCRLSTTSTDVSIDSIAFKALSGLISCQFWQSALHSPRPFLSRRTLGRSTNTFVTSSLNDMCIRERAADKNSKHTHAHTNTHTHTRPNFRSACTSELQQLNQVFWQLKRKQPFLL